MSLFALSTSKFTLNAQIYKGQETVLKIVCCNTHVPLQRSISLSAASALQGVVQYLNCCLCTNYFIAVLQQSSILAWVSALHWITAENDWYISNTELSFSEVWMDPKWYPVFTYPSVVMSYKINAFLSSFCRCLFLSPMFVWVCGCLM